MEREEMFTLKYFLLLKVFHQLCRVFYSGTLSNVNDLSTKILQEAS